MTKKKNSIVPEPTLRRLPWYLAYVKLLSKRDEKVVSSTYIAKSIGVDSALVAKDLSYVSLSGKTRVGYDVSNMVEVLEEFLGFNDQHRAYLFGVGNLGAALITDKGLEQYGLEIVAGFDVRADLCGTEVAGLPIYHLDELSQKATSEVSVGILTVPISAAQSVADEMVRCGIKAIWNFTPLRVVVPEGVVVQNTSMYAHLAVMFNRLKHSNF